eukprot:403348994
MQNGFYFILAADNAKPSDYKREGFKRYISAIYSRFSTQFSQQSIMQSQDQQSSQQDKTSLHLNYGQKVISNSTTFNQQTNFKEDFSKNQINSESVLQTLIKKIKNQKMIGNLSRTSLSKDSKFSSTFTNKRFHSPILTQKKGLLSQFHQESRYTSNTPRNSNVLCDLFVKQTLKNQNSKHKKHALKQGTPQSALSKGLEVQRKQLLLYGVLNPIQDYETESEKISEQEDNFESLIQVRTILSRKKLEDNASQKIKIDLKSHKERSGAKKKSQSQISSVVYLALNGEVTISMPQLAFLQGLQIFIYSLMVCGHKDSNCDGRFLLWLNKHGALPLNGGKKPHPKFKNQGRAKE